MFHTYRKIFDLLTPRERRRFLLILLLVMVMGLFDMVGVASILPFLAVAADPDIAHQNRLIAYLYDLAGYQSDHAFMIFLGGLVLCLLVAGFIVKTTTLYALSRFSQMRHHSIAMRLFSSYLAQPYPWFLREHSAKLAQTVLSQVTTVINSAVIPATRIIAQGTSVLFLIGLLVVLQPVVAVSTAVVLGGVYGMIFLVSRQRLSRIGKEQIAANQARFRVAQEALTGIKDVKLLGIEGRFVRQFSKPSQRASELASALMLIGELPRYLLETVAFGGMVLVVLILLVIGNAQLSAVLPVLGVFAFAGMRMFPALQMIYYSMTQLRSGRPALDQIHADLQKLSVPQGSQQPREVPAMALSERLELEDIGFSYAGTERQSLAGLNLKVPARTTVGIVGGSGAGKTSAVDVILGLLVAQTGALKVDGVEVTDANRRSWQNSLGYVPQQIFLIDDSVAGNIAFGLPPAERDQEAVERSARIANLHDFVMSELPQGYQTPVGERGVRLSGGQRQRIGIARALYHDPDVLILDEATSALDNLTERAVMEAVHNLGHKKTIIMIAHRLTTVKECDRIFLMEGGRVVDEGTYEELVAGNDLFRQMANG